jgi:hypothetical protein
MVRIKSFEKEKFYRLSPHSGLDIWIKRLSWLLGFLLLFQCSLKTPTAPRWNTTLTIPLVKKNYDMVTLIEKIGEPSLRADSLGNLFFHIEEDLDTIRLLGKLVCDSVTENFKDTLGIVKITPSESKQVTLWAADFYGGELGLVPPGDTTIQTDLDTFTSFYQATIQQGYGSLKATNRLGFNLDSLKFDIIDKVSSNTIQTLIIPGGILDNDSIIQRLTFADKTFFNRFTIQINAHTPGGIVRTLDDKYFSLDLTIDSLTLTQGIAKVPGFDLTQEEEILLPSNHVIDSAKVKTGSLHLELYNFTNISSDMEIDFPEFEKNGEMLKANNITPALGHSHVELSLDGYSFKPLSGSSINAQIKMHTDGSGDQLVSLTSSDSVTASAFLSKITFSQISGRLEPTEVDIGEIKRELDLPPGFENAHVKNASLSLDIHNGVNFPAQLSATIEGDKGQRLELAGDIEAGTPWATAVTSIQENHLDPLLDPVPQKITLTGQVTCGDGISSGIVNEEDFFFGKVQISSPLELILDSCRVQIDPDSHSLNEDVRSLLEDQVNSSRMVIKIESHLPLDAKVWILVSKNQEDIFSNPDLVIGPANVPGGELDGNGLVTSSTLSKNAVSLTHDELQVFKNSPFYIAGKLDFPGTKGYTVKAQASDFVQITSYVELEVRNKKD